ncbi:MAG: SBBP repeat-containing protein [Planctomycetia bacterium]|nr:SBBP repeat-containing protein [Planctomycetia bacterium]
MKREMRGFVVLSVVLLLILSLPNILLAGQDDMSGPSSRPSNPQSEIQHPKLNTAEITQRTKKLQMPFIANEGQTDEKVAFYANTFGGTVFVTKDGEIVYALPYRKNVGADARTRPVNPPVSPMNKGRVERFAPPFARGNTRGFEMHPISPVPDSSGQAGPQHGRKQGASEAKQEKEARGVVLKEEIVGGRINKIQGEMKSITTVNDFRGNDPSKHKTHIPTYDVVTLGEAYEGIELKLKAYGNNVEKLFYVKPGADPGMIKMKLSGAKALRVNEEGQLEAETALGIVKFTKPIVYQEPKVPSSATKENRSSAPLEGRAGGDGDIGGRQYIESTYVVTGNEYSFKLEKYDKTQGIVIDPLLASTYLGGSGSGFDSGNAIAIDSHGNIYVAGETQSSDFPTTTGAYNTSGGGGFVSKFNGDLTSLLASTYIGVSISAIIIDTEGNIYVAGGDTVLKLNGALTSLLVSKSLSGGSISSIAIDTGGNVYVAGGDTVSKFNGDLTSLLASKSLSGGTISAIAIDAKENIYVTGWSWSSDFPTTQGAYDTSFNGSDDAFVSKLNGDLTSLISSTYLGGINDDRASSIAIDSGEMSMWLVVLIHCTTFLQPPVLINIFL